jgi:hypothetical protein
MKAYRGVDVQTHVFLTSALVGDEWSASRLGRFTGGERAHGTHSIGGWVDPKAPPVYTYCNWYFIFRSRSMQSLICNTSSRAQ